MPSSLTTPTIDIGRFHDLGYLLFEGLFGEEELEEYRREADRVLDMVLGSSLLLQRRNPRLDLRLLGGSEAMVRKIQPINDLSPIFAGLSSDERVLGRLRAVMGDEPLLMEEKLNYKQRVRLSRLDAHYLEQRRPDGAAGEFLLHHDWGYYRANSYPDTTLSSAIALDDTTGRGPLRVLPRSHLLEVPLADPESPSGVVREDAVNSSGLVTLNMSAGSVLIFHSRLLHDSEPNPTSSPRRLMIYSHYPASHSSADPDRRNAPTRQAANQMESEYSTMPNPDRLFSTEV
jgi:hypothetical protein